MSAGLTITETPTGPVVRLVACPDGRRYVTDRCVDRDCWAWCALAGSNPDPVADARGFNAYRSVRVRPMFGESFHDIVGRAYSSHMDGE